MIEVLDELADSDLEAHTSVVLAYNVDLLFYDKLVRRRLAAAGATSQLVFCDATPYGAALDGVDAQSRIGRAYSVTPIRVEGAFHPKAYMLLGRRKARLILGSGNSSIGGLVRNAEVFGRFDFDEADGVAPHPAFAAIFDLAKSLAVSAVPAVGAQLARAEAWTPWLRSGGTSPDERVLHIAAQKGTRLLSALQQAVAGERITRVVAMSASFDRKLEGVRELAQLGQGTHETFVVVQGAHVNIDGPAVSAMPKNVRWREFVDPRPSKKQQPSDSYAHAKLYLIETETYDHLFFGSANLSSPALLTGANAELLVQAPREPVGTWVERLALGDSLINDVRAKLLSRTWKAEDDRVPGLLQLGGVEWSPGRGWVVSLAVARMKTGARLATGERPQRSTVTLALESEGERFIARSTHALEGTRFAWIVDPNGKQLSTVVAVTWPEVSRTSLGGWFGSGVEAAILNMKHGDVLGPILFEFLDRIPDLNVMAIGSALKKAKPDEPPSGGDDADRTIESFYTDATAEQDNAERIALGDRSDLDLLASLVQPITVQSAPRDADEDVDEDDSSLSEEQERRALDSKKAAADGSERAASTTLPTAARMFKAGKRFTRRVRHAADSLLETQTAIAQAAIAKQNVVLPPGLVARQVWMAYIAAFVAGRAVETVDEGDQVVVETEVVAHYVLRCAGALAGDASGGLLRAISPASWNSRDGVTLLDGLRFLVAACSWAVTWFEQQYARTGWSPDDDQHEAVGIHDAIPLVVLARLIGACDEKAEPDFSDARRRLSPWSDVVAHSVERAYKRALELSRWLVTVEREPFALSSRAHTPTVGSLARLQGTGVAVVLRVDGDKVWVSMLSRSSKPVVKFKTSSTRLVQPPSVGVLLLAPLPAFLFS